MLSIVVHLSQKTRVFAGSSESIDCVACVTDVRLCVCTSAAEPTEYCELESFQPRCPADHVVQVTEARYGLVSLGRCLAADYGYVGCFADVIDYVGARCSGRRFCRQEVPDKFLSAAATKCRPEFKSFLLASYRCLPGTLSNCATFGKQPVVRCYF
jgi:hypothetical protein